ncbi:uncharacterized protein A4U43_C01F13830 [Asparagus officinalis]|uniref:Uncharacterized protein n=1 Tax=Asparagus officinalis TaxID=4686 RepID=A0A5P1FPZ3_ASPOF|nr:uncharacterized protein A4U43_C01F13830 [Asparagus officinalis]
MERGVEQGLFGGGAAGDGLSAAASAKAEEGGGGADLGGAARDEGDPAPVAIGGEAEMVGDEGSGGKE